MIRYEYLNIKFIEFVKNISGLDLGQEEETDPDQMKGEGREIDLIFLLKK